MKKIKRQLLFAASVIFYLLAVAQETDSISNPVEQVKRLNLLAKKSISSNPINSLTYTKQASKIAETMGDTLGLAEATKLAGNINYLLGNYTEALDHFLDSYALYESLNDTLSMAGLRGSSGLVYKATEQYERSLENYEQAHQLLKKIDNDGIKAKLYNNQGVIYRRLKDYSKAEEYFNRSLEIKTKNGDQKGMANSFTNLGNVKADKLDYAGALAFFERSLTIEEALGSKEGVAMNLNNISNLYFKQKNYGKAIQFAERGLKIGQELQTKIQIKESAQILAEAYAATQDYRRAFEKFQLFHAANDSLFNEQEARKIGRLESKLELERKQRELDKMEQSNQIAKIEIGQKRTQQTFIIIIAVILIGGLVFVVANQKQKSQLKEKALQSELSELRVEIKTLIGKYEGTLDVDLEELNAKLVNPLSEREYDVFRQIYSQKTNSEIAAELFVSINTVKTHLKNLYNKLGVSNRKEALDVILKV